MSLNQFFGHRPAIASNTPDLPSVVAVRFTAAGMGPAASMPPARGHVFRALVSVR